MSVVMSRARVTRTANMAARRERILDTAREIISEAGFDALNLRVLAERARVTVPTIYNLVGNKSAVVEQLFDQTISPFENLRYITDDEDPGASPERFFDKVVAAMAENESYHRAEFLAREHLEASGDDVALAIHARILNICIDACVQAQNAGLLAGAIDTDQLAQLIEHQFRLAYHDWAYGNINLEEFRRRVVAGTYLCFTADATPVYHTQFVAKLHTFRPQNL